MTEHSRRWGARLRRALPRLVAATGLVALTLVAPAADALVNSMPDEQFWAVSGLPGAVDDATDARVYAILEANGRIYIGGDFTLAVRPDGSTVERRNLIALDAATGQLDETFTPEPGNTVRALEMSPDGSRLYVAGPFSRFNNEDHLRLAAIDPVTGDSIPGWRVDANAPAWSLELSPDGTVLYVGGMFTALTDGTGLHPRGYLGAIRVDDLNEPDPVTPIVLDNWRADTVGYTEEAVVIDPITGRPVIVCTTPIPGQPPVCTPLVQTTLQPGFVRALQMSRDGSRLLVGGEFVSVGGVSLRNLASLNAATGAVDRNFADSSRRVFDIEVDASRIYVALGGGGGEGRALNPVTGRELWAVNSNGDFQAVAVIRNAVYFGGHFDPDELFEGQPRSKLAAVEAATGDLLPFAPDVNSALGVWTLHASAHNLHVGGDFTRIGDARRPHYVRLTGLPEPPDAPTGVIAAAGDREATVSWTPPAYDGLRPILGYTVTPYRNGVQLASVTFASPATSQTVGGLDNGIAFTFTVTAMNEAGSGEASAQSAAVTPLAMPTMLAAPVATPGDAAVNLTWAEAADDGGSPVTGYRVTPYRAGVAQTPLPAPLSPRTLTVTGLTNGVPYAFAVAATNMVGTGRGSPLSAAVTPRTVPGAPGGVMGGAGSGRVTISWAAPADDGGSPVTAYVVTPYRAGVAGPPQVFSPQTTGDVTGLDNGVAYTFTVAAVNAAGQGAASAPSPPVTPRSGYWMIDAGGKVYAFGQVSGYGDPAGRLGQALAVDVEPTPSGNGYWVLADGGGVFAHGDAGYFSGVPASALRHGERVTGLSATRSGAGYWIFTTLGRVFARGDAPHLGDLSGIALNGPVLDSIATPSGRGYYMVASDGGIFTFGDALFAGSMGGQRLNAPVMSMAPDPDGDGYWLVASDGGIFAFRAGFRGSLGAIRLNKPVTGMVVSGNGYLLVASDGGIFNFSDQPFHGSLGASPPAQPIMAAATL